MSNGELQPASPQQIQDAKEYARKGNRNGLILFLIIISLVGGCSYGLVKWSKGYEASGKAYGGSHSSDDTK